MNYKRTEEQKEDCWKELNRALKRLFKDRKYSPYTNPNGITIQFAKGDGGDNLDKEIHLYIEGIDNIYDKSIYDENLQFRWEIFLNRNGTWTIK